MILVDLLTGVVSEVGAGVGCNVSAGPGCSAGVADVSGTAGGALGVMGDPTGVEKGVGGGLVGGGEVVSLAVSGNVVGIVEAAVGGPGVADMGGSGGGPGWGTVTGENFLRN